MNALRFSLLFFSNYKTVKAKNKDEHTIYHFWIFGLWHLNNKALESSPRIIKALVNTMNKTYLSLY